MNDNCKECPYIQSLKNDVSSLKSDIKDFDERLLVVEKFSASGGEQIKMIFKILNEIKDSIRDVNTKLETIEKQPGEDYSKIKLTIITSICSGMVGAVLGFIFSKI